MTFCSQVCVCAFEEFQVVLAGNMHNYVHFPRAIENERQNIKKFYAIAGFPHVAACIDGTLIKIASPGKAIAEIFRSRKGFISLNVMGVTGPRGEFLFLDVRHPGSVHDQTCFDRSALKMMFIENRITGLLLGDNGYGCQPYLRTPVLNPLNEAERNYNRRHIKTRNTIVRAFGRWKRKFSCLKRCLLNSLDNSIAIICATAILWNLHIHLHCPILDFQNELDEDDYLDDNAPRNVNGLDYRLNFIVRHFLQQ